MRGNKEDGIPCKLQFDLMCLLVVVCSRALELGHHKTTAPGMG